MDLRKLKKLIDLVEESGIQELEVTEGEEKVRITRTIQGAPQVVSVPAQFPYPYPPQMQAPMVQAAPIQPGQSQAMAAQAAQAAARSQIMADDSDDSLKGYSEDEVMKSPMVGTFYRAASPNVPPFVEVGQHVHKGDTLCIIEAMKLMNEIECDRDGVVVEILKNNAEPVEYGEAMFVIR